MTIQGAIEELQILFNAKNVPIYYKGVIKEIIATIQMDTVPKDFHDKTCEAMAKRHTEEIQRLMSKRGKPDFADCEKCSRTYGTLGCCSTVSNEWVYSCLEGMLEKAYADGIKSVKPKRGEWIDNTSETWTPSKKCSECGLVVHSVATDSTDFHAKLKMNFCPRCGADMRKEGE